VKKTSLRLAGLGLALVLLAFPAGASAAPLFNLDGAFGSALQPNGRFIDAAGVATDNAGRVYVADTGSGQIEVFDSGEAGNGYLASIGAGVLSQPVGVAVDLRNRIFVADAGREKVFQFDRFTDGAPYMREWGGPGTEIGKMSGPRMVVPDRSGLIYNTEAGNVRVQWFTPKSGEMVPVAAFGTADPPIFDNPEGIARDDRAAHLYVTNNSATDGAVRVYDSRGLMLGQLTGPGKGNASLTSPRGIAVDPFGRVVVADTGGNRLKVYASFADGGGLLDTYGAGGDVNRPVGVAFAPGAYLYATDAGTGRVLRFRFDDADRDWVMDPIDNCPGLANPDQSDWNRNGIGDPCDPAGAPPAPKRLARDAAARSSVAPAMRTAGGAVRGFRGTARGRHGVRAVEVAVAREVGDQCSWYRGHGRFAAPGSCARPVWIRAHGTRHWSARLALRGAGTYRVRSRAVERRGVREALATPRNTRIFLIG
jgi:hypothetical protein